MLENRINQMRYNRMHKDFNELWKDGFAEGVAGGGGGRCGCAPSYSVDSCLQWSNGVWWVEVLSYHVFLSSSGMYCCMILTSLSQCGSYPQIPGRRLTGMTASLSYRGDVRTQSSVVRPLVFFPHLKRDTQRLRTCRSSLSLSP